MIVVYSSFVFVIYSSLWLCSPSMAAVAKSSTDHMVLDVVTNITCIQGPVKKQQF